MNGERQKQITHLFTLTAEARACSGQSCAIDIIGSMSSLRADAISPRRSASVYLNLWELFFGSTAHYIAVLVIDGIEAAPVPQMDRDNMTKPVTLDCNGVTSCWHTCAG
jgi:hypothetical protein